MHTAVLIFFGSLALGFVGVWLLYSLGTRGARNSPATPAHAFSREVPDTAPGQSQRPKLSANGRVMVFFAFPAGLIGLAISWATVHRLLEDHRHEQAPTATAATVNHKRRASDAINPASNRPLETSLPLSVALLPPAVFDVAFLWLVWKLRRDYVLIRRGRLSMGIVVGFAGNNKAPGLQSLVTTFYDFLDAQGTVRRGHSILAHYTGRGPYCHTAVGSGVEVFYMLESPERNALRGSLSWDV